MCPSKSSQDRSRDRFTLYIFRLDWGPQVSLWLREENRNPPFGPEQAFREAQVHRAEKQASAAGEGLGTRRGPLPFEEKPGHTSAHQQLFLVLGDAGSERAGFKCGPGPEELGEVGALQPSRQPGFGLYVVVP